MKILYDYQIFYLHKFGGISNFFTQLMKNLPAEVEFELALKESDNVHLRESGIFDIPYMTCSPKNFLVNGTFRGKATLYNLCSNIFPMMTSYGRNKKASIEALKRGDFDIFNPTFYDGYFLPYLNGKPFVLHIYDMISEKFFSSKDPQTIEKRRLASQASHIIAISKKTKEDTIEILGVPEKKVSVVYLATTDISDVADSKPIVEGKYILYVGNRNIYKNYIPMMKELLSVFNYHQELKMVCTGPDFNDIEKSFFIENKIKDRIIHLSPSDEELRNLYSHAVCFIFPSLYEGFGIPILESWQAKCPALLNKKSCFPEIAGDASVFFNLDNNGSNLKEVMENFLNISNEERQSIIDKQNRRLADFSWKKTAEQTVNIYRNILQK